MSILSFFIYTYFYTFITYIMDLTYFCYIGTISIAVPIERVIGDLEKNTLNSVK